MTTNYLAAHHQDSLLTPLQSHIQKMSLCRALLEAKRWMDDRDTRFSVLRVNLSEVLDPEAQQPIRKQSDFALPKVLVFQL